MSEPDPPAVSPVADVASRAERTSARRPGDFLRGLARIMRTAALYGPEHPVTAQTLAEVHHLLAALLGERPVLRLVIYEDAFFVDDVLLLEESLQLHSLLVEMRVREMIVTEFHRGVEPQEIGRLVEVLNLGSGTVIREGVATLLAQREVRHIIVGSSVNAPPRTAHFKYEPKDAYRAGLRAIEELNYQGSRNLSLALHKARVVIASFIDIITRDRVALMGVTALRHHDEETCHHSVNVCILSLLLGFRLGMDRTLLSALGLAALLHDIGKVRIPREVLTKAGRLTPEEQRIVRRHAVLGAHLLRTLSGPSRLAILAAFEHHANYDLTGYPAITTKRRPHLVSRIVQIADYFDAMTSARRPYRRALLPSEAMYEIARGAGTTYDPFLARVFTQVMGLYPVGSVVELDCGLVAVVVRPGETDLARPGVRVVRNQRWEAVPHHVINLETQRERSIRRALDPVAVGLTAAEIG